LQSHISQKNKNKKQEEEYKGNMKYEIRPFLIFLFPCEPNERSTCVWNEELKIPFPVYTADSDVGKYANSYAPPLMDRLVPEVPRTEWVKISETKRKMPKTTANFSRTPFLLFFLLIFV
jgi:hypothetical protein